jgi:Tfp pilus assembly protein PilF
MAYTFLKKDEEGLAEYRKTLELKPGLYEAELNGGILLLREKNPADALPLLEDASSQKPKEFAPRFYLAEAQLQSGLADQAVDNYRQAAEIDPQSATAELGWGRALALAGKLDEAAPHFRAAIARDSRYHDALLSLAELYEEHKQIPEALAIYREFPGNAEVQEHAGHLLLESQKYDEAVRQLEQAYQKAPTAANRKSLAAAYLQVQQVDKALPLLEKAVAEEPGNYDLRMGYAHALRDSKQYQAAAAQFNQAAKLKPAETKTWNELGSMLYLSDDRDGALAALDQARQLGDNSPGNWFLTAIMLDAAHRSKPALAKQAIAAYRKFLAVSDGKSPNQEFQARQRAKILQRELDKR